jgi:hypothetical protein
MACDHTRVHRGHDIAAVDVEKRADRSHYFSTLLKRLYQDPRYAGQRPYLAGHAS